MPRRTWTDQPSAEISMFVGWLSYFSAPLFFCQSETSVALKKKVTLRHLTVFLPSRNKRKRQILCCFSLTKSTHKKPMVGAWVSLSRERWREDSHSSSTPQISCTHLSRAHARHGDLHTLRGTERYPHLWMISSLGGRTGCSLQPRAGWELTEAGFR